MVAIPHVIPAVVSRLVVLLLLVAVKPLVVPLLLAVAKQLAVVIRSAAPR
ncbi:MAG: hypothetical protein QF408_07680 [Pirellulales bacterium]|nr:hypothetical protein [Pirellulales bacterium]HJN65059.1 hypothetical protein [Pirellulales bacterium]